MKSDNRQMVALKRSLHHTNWLAMGGSAGEVDTKDSHCLMEVRRKLLPRNVHITFNYGNGRIPNYSANPSLFLRNTLQATPRSGFLEDQYRSRWSMLGEFTRHANSRTGGRDGSRNHPSSRN